MEITPSVIASFINGEVEGDGNVSITGFAKIEEAKPGDISFIANPKYEHYIYTTKATAVLVRNEFKPEGKISPVLIRVKDPYVALAGLLNAMQQSQRQPQGIETPSYVSEGVKISEDTYIGAFSYISTGVVLGKNVKIYPQVYIGANVRIGDNTILRPGVKVYQDCQIGNNCIIHSGAVIGADGFGFAPCPDGSYEKIPQIGNVIIGNDVEIGANTTVDRATFGSTRVGDGTKLDNLIQIAHNVEVGKNNVMAAQVGIAGSTKIGNNNRIGGQVGIAGHLHIGNQNEIGAQSGVHTNIEDKKRMIGYPAVDIKTFAKNAVYMKKLDELFRNRK